MYTLKLITMRRISYNNKRLKRIVLLLLLICSFTAGNANDGVFMVNGSQLTPVKETDVAIVREVLTITLRDDDIARVDVMYELENRSSGKNVDVGFVAHSPTGVEDEAFETTRHPFMKNFSVEMNGKQLPVRCYIMAAEYGKQPDFTPLDMRKWRGYTQQLEAQKDSPYQDGVFPDELYSVDGDSTTGYAYAYCFKANFKKGRNVIHHTYNYVMSNGVYSIFSIPYTLTPAMRWANHQIDDFTLRVNVEGTAKHFCINRGPFSAAPFKVTTGAGKHRTVASAADETDIYEEVALRNGTIEWHCKNFSTTEEMQISSAEYIQVGTEYSKRLGAFYDRTIGQFNFPDIDTGKSITDGIDPQRIRRNLPYANRGYVFRDKKLQEYFNKLFWYMPDPQWKQSTDNFTPAEWQLIRGE